MIAYVLSLPVIVDCLGCGLDYVEGDQVKEAQVTAGMIATYAGSSHALQHNNTCR